MEVDMKSKKLEGITTIELLNGVEILATLVPNISTLISLVFNMVYI